MEKSYSYPIDLDWTQDEMIQVIDLWRMVELAYEKGVSREDFLMAKIGRAHAPWRAPSWLA